MDLLQLAHLMCRDHCEANDVNCTNGARKPRPKPKPVPQAALLEPLGINAYLAVLGIEQTIAPWPTPPFAYEPRVIAAVLTTRDAPSFTVPDDPMGDTYGYIAYNGPTGRMVNHTAGDVDVPPFEGPCSAGDVIESLTGGTVYILAGGHGVDSNQPTLAGWRANQRYAAGDAIADPSGHIQVVATLLGPPGESGSTMPAWNDSGGGTLDGQVVWSDAGPATLLPLPDPSWGPATAALVPVPFAVGFPRAPEFSLPDGYQFYGQGPTYFSTDFGGYDPTDGSDWNFVGVNGGDGATQSWALVTGVYPIDPKGSWAKPTGNRDSKGIGSIFLAVDSSARDVVLPAFGVAVVLSIGGEAVGPDGWQRLAQTVSGDMHLGVWTGTIGTPGPDTPYVGATWTAGGPIMGTMWGFTGGGGLPVAPGTGSVRQAAPSAGGDATFDPLGAAEGGVRFTGLGQTAVALRTDHNFRFPAGTSDELAPDTWVALMVALGQAPSSPRLPAMTAQGRSAR